MSEIISAKLMRDVTYQAIGELNCIQKLNQIIKATAAAGGKKVIIKTKDHPEFLISNNPELQRLSHQYRDDAGRQLDFEQAQDEIEIVIFNYYRHLGFDAGTTYDAHANDDHNFIFSVSWL